MLKRITLLFCIVSILAPAITGCFDVREIDDQVYALSVGVDKGTYSKVRLTVQYPTYKSSSEGGGSSQKGPSGGKNENAQTGSNVATVEAPTMLEAVDMLNTAVSRRISLMHTKWYIFSEEFAREGIDGYISGLERFRETRGSSAIVVARGTAEDFIKANESTIGDSLSKSIELHLMQSNTSGFFPDARFTDFYVNLFSPYRSPITLYGGVNDLEPPYDMPADPGSIKSRENLIPGELPRSGVSKIELAGLAVFNGGKMVGSLDAHEAACYMMITGKYNGGKFSIPDRYKPDRAIVFDIHKSRQPSIKAYFKNGKPIMDINIKLESEIYVIQSRIDYEQLSHQGELESQIEDYLLDCMKKTVKKTQKEFKTDIFGFGEWIAGNFSTITEFEAYNWLSHYPEAVVNISVDAKVRRTGVIFHSSPLFDSSGKGE
jgi:spore germination protein KC